MVKRTKKKFSPEFIQKAPRLLKGETTTDDELSKYKQHKLSRNRRLKIEVNRRLK